MPHLDLAGLQRYAQKEKEWADLRFASAADMNWQKTAAAGAVSFSPVPETPIDPVVNFAFTETGPAEGTKGPDNPSTITGVTQAKVTRCGKNIIKLPFYDITKTVNGVTFTADNATGTVTVNSDGPATATSNFYLMPNGNAKLFAGENYFLSGCPAGGSVSTYYLGGSRYSFDGDYVSSVSADTGSGSSLSFNSDWSLNCVIRIVAGTTVSNLVFKPQLELGSTATSFEPYSGADYTVNLGGTYYGGSVDLSTGVMTVTHVECVADGTNIYAQSSVGDIGVSYRHAINVVTFGLPAPIIGDYESSSSTHFSCISGLFDSFGVFSQASQYIIVCDKDGLYPTNQSFNDWLKAQNASGTPVKFVYTVANPFTIPLTPLQIYSLSQTDPYTPRINTVYSDQQSVQVGYPKSPLATSNELTNAIISLGGNV